RKRSPGGRGRGGRGRSRRSRDRVGTGLRPSGCGSLAGRFAARGEPLGEEPGEDQEREGVEHPAPHSGFYPWEAIGGPDGRAEAKTPAARRGVRATGALRNCVAGSLASLWSRLVRLLPQEGRDVVL